METFRLISMTDFVLGQRMTTEEVSASSFYDIQTHIYKYYDKVFNYATFLKQPLQLGFFVPCDENGNVLEEPQMRPERNSFDEEDVDYDAQELYEYIEAKKRVLFKDSVFYEKKPHFQTKRILIMLNNKPDFRIYNQFNYWDGRIEKQYFPNNENLTIEDLVNFKLELTDSAIEQIGL